MPVDLCHQRRRDSNYLLMLSLVVTGAINIRTWTSFWWTLIVKAGIHLIGGSTCEEIGKGLFLVPTPRHHEGDPASSISGKRTGLSTTSSSEVTVSFGRGIGSCNRRMRATPVALIRVGRTQNGNQKRPGEFPDKQAAASSAPTGPQCREAICGRGADRHPARHCRGTTTTRSRVPRRPWFVNFRRRPKA